MNANYTHLATVYIVHLSSADWLLKGIRDRGTIYEKPQLSERFSVDISRRVVGTNAHALSRDWRDNSRQFAIK